MRKEFFSIILILLLSGMPPIVFAEEPSLQEWFTSKTYAINVTTNETGMETFPAGHYRLTILDEIADYAPKNTFGWYSLSNGTYHQLFSGKDSANSSIEFSTTEPFGFYIGSPEGTFHTEKSKNKDDFDHAWVFKDPKTEDGYVITWEDLWMGGDKDFQDMIITIRALRLPHAAFTWLPQMPQTKETVAFNASASTPDGGTIIEYEWNFGDGNVTKTSNPIITHVYQNFGFYTVRLRVTDSDGKSDTVSHTITVRGYPHAAFTYYPTNPTVNQEIVFNASKSTPDGGVIISYAWNFGDSEKAQGMIVTHKYVESGNYMVMLNVTDSEGKWDVEIKIIEVQKPPSKPGFTVKIENTSTSLENEYKFQASAYCKTFKAEVWIIDALDLYSYAFCLDFDSAIIQLTEHEVRHVHAEDRIVSEEVDNFDGTYRQAVTAKGSAGPYNGSAPVTTIRFHIINDPCYPYNYTSILKLTETRMFDAKNIAITHWKQDGRFKIFTKKPSVSMGIQGKIAMTKWIVNETFTLEINLTDIIKTKGFFLELGWGTCLETDHQKIEVTYFLPPPYESYGFTLNDTTLTVRIRIPAEKPAINGTGTILRITFKAKNPWGNIPPYKLVGDEYLPENCTCKIWIVSGWIDVYCPEYRRMEFYNCTFGVEVKNQCTYNFTPVPGDLNLDGKVDAIDLSAISQWVGYTPENPEWSICKGFDLNRNGIVDLTDVVIVAANFGRNRP